MADKCPECGGMGKVEPRNEFPDGTVLVQPGFIRKCPTCKGTGRAPGSTEDTDGL